MPDVARSDGGLDAVSERSECSRHRHGREARAISIADVCEMEHQPSRNSEPSPMPVRGQRQMDFAGKYIGEVVERQRRLVREHPGLLTPEPGYDEVFVIAGREVHETINAPPDAGDFLAAEIGEQLRRVARSCCLLGREVASLRLRQFEQSIPIGGAAGLLAGRGQDAQTLSQTLVLCNASGDPRRTRKPNRIRVLIASTPASRHASARV